jgi:hypothetical protein
MEVGGEPPWFFRIALFQFRKEITGNCLTNGNAAVVCSMVLEVVDCKANIKCKTTPANFFCSSTPMLFTKVRLSNDIGHSPVCDAALTEADCLLLAHTGLVPIAVKLYLSYNMHGPNRLICCVNPGKCISHTATSYSFRIGLIKV